jgi:hypothetical protein
MRGVFLLVIGVVAGFVLAHQVAKTPEGKRFFADVDHKTREFSEAVMDGYKSRESELRAAVAEAESVIADLSKRAN